MAGAIRKALLEITDHYDDALIPPRLTSGVKQPTAPVPADVHKIKPARKVFEHSPAPVSLAVLDARRDAHADLAHYARVVLNEVNEGAITTHVNGESPFALARFLDVWALALAEQLPEEASAAARLPRPRRHAAAVRASRPPRLGEARQVPVRRGGRVL